MFEDQANLGQSVPPANLPTEPDDMFAGVEKNNPPTVPAPPNALDAGLLKPKTNMASDPPISRADQPVVSKVQTQIMPESPTMYKMREPILGKIILFIFFGALIAGLVYGGWWAYNNFIKVPSVPNVPATTIPEQAVPTTQTVPETPAVTEQQPTSTSEVTGQMTSDQILFGEAIDTDKDGLDDVREEQLGTDINISDTDGDGLSDGDEAIIWQTDPLNPDTDGDSYPDGTEVFNGYSPLGPGRLNLVPNQATTTAQ